ncbi:hypothetical protein E3P92_00499 [Wallemia ichthyophaga]|uniref:Protein kinase domain-containing protein n=2 Tax=Wallemia ichthyophaga TaxID=245174 RepID=A0A4T0IBC9_WALIC|nr:Sperm motility kinase X [Wallemia ichthyophaga EXF-994]TIB03477.1 hypothetical protein E3P95_00565 [Wallemia ichthyophaga]EOR01507.1 Sperm motility kinase X [Wallemia ichthyophaga EXF-994]TIB03689.1 hypothetical protein E3P96_01797 [Wallemia ichthyophaga]TIB04201.1 hypothetical protein E3P94_00705 [Wallemia ichthyophaga]TIB13198.1 hypothetical protein E3P90_01743 [Wallemia ichthyophaga]
MSNAASSISPALEFLSGFSYTSNSPPSRVNEGDNVDDFVIGSVLSSGSSALVRNAKHLPSATAVAVRIVYQSNNSQIRSEIDRWLSLNHNNILPLLHFSELSDFLLTFSPICSTTLLSYINKYHSTGMSLRKTHNIFNQLALGVRYLHQQCSLVHRDLKLENILLDSAGNWVISDFGLSQSLEETESLGDMGSLPYASPELIKPPPEQLTTVEWFDLLKKADVWALGCILYALLSGKLPFADAFVPRLQMKILGGNYKRLNSISRSRERSNTRSRSRSRVRGTDEAAELAAMGVLEMCLTPVADLRPFIQDVLDTEWVASGYATRALDPPARRMRSRSSSRNRSSRSRSRSRARNPMVATPMSNLSPVNEQVNGDGADEERERGRPTIKRALAK